MSFCSSDFEELELDPEPLSSPPDATTAITTISAIRIINPKQPILKIFSF